MIMQEYLKTFDALQLFEVYYENYSGELNDDVTKDDEQALFLYSIHKMLTMKVDKNHDAVMIPVSYLDDEYEDDECEGEGQWVGKYWRRIVIRYEMQFIKLSDIKELPELPLITKDSQTEMHDFPYQAYAYDFIGWKDSLGAELLYRPEDHEYEYMAEFMEELLFFGYDEETHDDKVEEETTELKRRMDEAEEDLEAHCIPADMDEMKKVCGIETKEDEEMERKFYDDLRCRNYNHRADVYNRLERPALARIIKKG